MSDRLMVTLRVTALALAMGLIGLGGAPAAAQDATEPAETTAAQVDDTATTTNEDEGGFDDWGLLGLLGLAGLLRRPARAVVVDPTPTTGTRRA